MDAAEDRIDPIGFDENGEDPLPRVCMFVIGAAKRSRGMSYANPYLRCCLPLPPGLDFCRVHFDDIAKTLDNQ